MSSTVLQVAGLALAYDGRPVLRGVDLRICAGEIRGLIGPNGSGKTTLIRSIAGLLPLQQGQIELLGLQARHAPDAYRAHLGYAPDPGLLPPRLSPRQCLEVIAAARGLSGIPEATLSQAQVLGLAPWLDRPLAQCSLGTRQKVAILQALLGRPQLLVLDEVLNGLDPLAAYALKQLLRAEAAAGSAILLSTHGLEAAVELLDSVDLLLDGRLARHFDAAELQQLRAAGPSAFEAAVVAALRAETV